MINSNVEVHDLSIHSDELCIVERLSLTLRRGNPVTILGETGSGKSLLALAIMGALPTGLTCRGEIKLFAQQTCSSSQRQSLWGRKIAMLPQEPWLSLDPIMTANKQLSLVEELVNNFTQAQAKQRAQHSLEEFGLGNDGHKVVSQLSGGMAQRLAYLCATAAGAEVLIADEPTKGLDASRKAQVIALLQQHSVKGSLLTITHDIDVANALDGEMIVMRAGQIVERGRSAEILAQPQSDYGRALIDAQRLPFAHCAPGEDLKAVLHAQQLTKSRGGSILFSALDMKVMQGQVVSIVGDSGMGKSTLADMLLGLVKPDRGDIWRCHGLSKGKILKLYQDPPAAFAQTITLGQNLADLCQLHRLDKAPIAGLMQQLALDDNLLTRLPAQVSGGELQRFAIMRALLMQPKVLVADEPTSRLDPITAAATMKLLIEQTQRIGCALLLISHDRDRVAQISDQIIDIADYAP